MNENINLLNYSNRINMNKHNLLPTYTSFTEYLNDNIRFEVGSVKLENIF